MNKISVYRKEYFNAAHKLFNPNWSDEENKRVFGKCNNQNYHGHNYEVITKVTGLPDLNTGFVMDLKQLSELIEREIINRFDHKNLNLDTKEFENLNPTAENIVVVIYNLLRPFIASKLDLRITLFETERNYVKYPA